MQFLHIRINNCIGKFARIGHAYGTCSDPLKLHRAMGMDAQNGTPKFVVAKEKLQMKKHHHSDACFSSTHFPSKSHSTMQISVSCKNRKKNAPTLTRVFGPRGNPLNRIIPCRSFFFAKIEKKMHPL